MAMRETYACIAILYVKKFHQFYHLTGENVTLLPFTVLHGAVSHAKY